MREREKMAERTENSVLVSLRELRGIEDDRLRHEQDEARARAEAARAAKEAAERRAVQEQADRVRAEEDRVRRLEEDKLARVREEQLRIEEADRRARVEGELKLQEQKMRLEIQSRAERGSPLKAIAIVAVVLVALGGVVLYKIQAANQAEITAQRDAQQRATQEERERHLAAQAELERKLAAISKDMEAKLKLANSEAEQAKIRAAAEKAKREASAEDRGPTRTARKSRASGDAPAPKPVGGRMPGKIDIKDDDILKGL
jgi:hypothetical protein